MNIRHGLFNRPVAVKEKLSKISKVEVETYVPLSRQVHEFTMAGRRAQSVRRFQYDMEHIANSAKDDKDFVFDITRYPGFDPAIAHQMGLALSRKFQEALDKVKSENVQSGSNDEENGSVNPPSGDSTVTPEGGSASQST